MAAKVEVKEDVIKVENGRLIIDVALDDDPPLSSSEKSHTHFSSHGNMPINDGFTIGLNLYKKIVRRK